MKLKDRKVVILISTLIALNVVIWYEIFGFKFALAIILLALSVVLHD